MGFLFPLLPSSREYSSAAVGLKPPLNNKKINEEEFGKNSLIFSPTRKEIWKMFKGFTEVMKLSHSSGDMKMIKSVDTSSSGKRMSE